MRRVHVQALPGPEAAVVLAPEEAGHLTRVLRLRAGDALLIFDGSGQQALAHLERRADRWWARQQCPAEALPPPMDITLLLALLKGPAMGRAVRMATEAGVRRILPVQAERSVARGLRRERWERILRSAATQCGRADLPHLEPPRTLAEALAATADLPLRFVARSDADPRRAWSATARSAAVVIGPAGGLSPTELQLCERAGWQPLWLGPHVLRAETASGIAVAHLGRLLAATPEQARS